MANQPAPLRIPLCPVCSLPAHASETDDLDRHRECQPESERIPLTCTTPDGDGTILYTTADGWYGVRLDSETTIHEWAASQVEVAS